VYRSISFTCRCNSAFRAGAKRVIIGAAPFDQVDAAIVYGVNQSEVKATDQIISSVSCTTQALVPLVKIIDDAFGIETALMTEIHAVTADQSVLIMHIVIYVVLVLQDKILFQPHQVLWCA
jgi:glyceraldehyde-3-phosphate dehydrogenase/erythrose-4-phosphate dehydrogenase